MNYLKSIADALSATTFNFRKSTVTLRHPMTLSRTELRQIVAEALG
jgi:hypothetical protein